MIDIHKQIDHLLQGADEDWQVAQDLVRGGRIRHGLFFAHLALEKTLKALVCQVCGDLAPPIHNLVRLAEQAELRLKNNQRELLAEVNGFNIEGRYPEMLLPQPTVPEARSFMSRIEELLACLQKMFKKPSMPI